MESLESGQARRVLAVPDFRRLWLVGLVGSVARWLEMLVIGVVVYQATDSALLVAAMTLLRMLPMGLFGAILGVMADRVPRRGALLAVLVLQAVAVGELVLADLLGTLAVWQIALASLLGGLGWATDNPVRRMLIGEAVGPARMSQAMSLDVMASNASRVAGPALGGTLLALLGPGAAFGLCLLFHLVSFATALRLTVGTTVERQRSRGVLQEMRESFAFALHHPRLRAVLLVTIVFNLSAWPCTSMIPVIGQSGLGLGPEGVGILASMDGLGALVGAALVGAFVAPHRHAAIYVGGTIIYLAMMAGFALSPSPLLAGLLLVAVGVGGAGFASMQATLIYLSAPPEQRSRALGVLSTAIGTGLLGFLQLGLLAESLGAATATAVVCAQGILVLAATWSVWKPLFQQD
ncbi:MFS transporter [Falsiroseomonas bella]|uniref:MFS transporter n=1 Tax=Falsiroseomonas bella TaxID=2184016 RepID=UPI001304EE43|nr:MFS transporter [Falsiroseomonas bella]